MIKRAGPHIRGLVPCPQTFEADIEEGGRVQDLRSAKTKSGRFFKNNIQTRLDAVPGFTPLAFLLVVICDRFSLVYTF